MTSHTKVNYKSDAFEAIHQTAQALHSIGAINKADLQEFDTSCLLAGEPQNTSEQVQCLGDLLACDDGGFDFDQYLPTRTEYDR